MKINYKLTRCCRPHGGMSLGITLHFPVTIAGDGDDFTTWQDMRIRVGLICWTWDVIFSYGKL